MKKFYLIAVFFALVSALGCSERTDEGCKDICTESASISVGLPLNISRIAVDEDGKTTWTAGDTFALWAENRTGGYVIDGALFKMFYYMQTYDSAVFTSSASGLEEGTYTYFATAPHTATKTGLMATHTLPADQEGTSFNGAYDIMVATPVEAEALTEDKVSLLGLDFSHKMHALKIAIAENNLGLPISQLRFTFPSAVTGSVQVNAGDPTEAATLSNGSTSLNVNIPEGVDVGGSAWGVIFPQNISGDVILTAVGTDGRLSMNKTISFDKDFAEGHITPLSLTVPEIKATLRFSIGTNNLGEEVQKLTIADHTGASVTFDANDRNIYDFSVESSDDSAFAHYQGQTFTATFESEHAIVSSTFVMPESLNGALNVIPALTVPYLFAEDFSCIHTAGESYGDNGQASDERKQPGVSLDSYMSHSGWNAARFLLGIGTCPRINARTQMVKIIMAFTSAHHGRLDTPPLTNLKDGATVALKVSFDAGGVEYEGASGDIVGISLATHTNLTNPIDGIPTGTESFSLNPLGPVMYSTTLADFGTTFYSATMASNFTQSSFGSTFPTHTADVTGATNQTRLCFYPTNGVSLSTIDNSEVAVYVDNIKVSIAQ